jgi:hypothetical protein
MASQQRERRGIGQEASAKGLHAGGLVRTVAIPAYRTCTRPYPPAYQLHPIKYCWEYQRRSIGLVRYARPRIHRRTVGVVVVDVAAGAPSPSPNGTLGLGLRAFVEQALDGGGARSVFKMVPRGKDELDLARGVQCIRIPAGWTGLCSELHAGFARW